MPYACSMLEKIASTLACSQNSWAFWFVDGGESLLAHRNGACRVKTAPPEIFLLKPEILLL
jgi:hypothetical protein